MSVKTSSHHAQARKQQQMAATLPKNQRYVVVIEPCFTLASASPFAKMAAASATPTWLISCAFAWKMRAYARMIGTLIGGKGGDWGRRGGTGIFDCERLAAATVAAAFIRA